MRHFSIYTVKCHHHIACIPSKASLQDQRSNMNPKKARKQSKHKTAQKTIYLYSLQWVLPVQRARGQCGFSFDIHVNSRNGKISPTNNALKLMKAPLLPPRIWILDPCTLRFIEWPPFCTLEIDHGSLVHIGILLFLGHLLAYKINPWECLM